MFGCDDESDNIYQRKKLYLKQSYDNKSDFHQIKP